MDYMSIINEVAIRHGASPEEVRAGIEDAIGQAFQRRNPANRRVWAEIAPDGVQPAPEDVVFRLAVSLLLSEGPGDICGQEGGVG